MKKRFMLVCLAVIVLTLGVSAALYPELPRLVPVHWNSAGEADAWDAPAMLFIPTALMVGLAALWLVLPKLSPRRFAVDDFEATWWYSGMIVVCLLAYLQGVHLWGAIRPDFAVDRAMFAGIGLFFVLAGNVMGKVRRNFWLGIRTPWTLANERVWYATHRLAAKTMVAGGLFACVLALTALPALFAMAAVIGSVLVPAGYSLVYYKRLERAGTLEA